MFVIKILPCASDSPGLVSMVAGPALISRTEGLMLKVR